MKKQTNLFKNYLIPIIAIFLLVVLDQFTKSLAVAKLKGQDAVDLIRDVFQLYYLENKGAAFGIMQNKQIIFTIGAVIIICLIAYFWMRIPFEKKYVPLRICGILIVSGALGNMIDRLAQNYVVDFFYFKLIDFPIFNVADIYVTVACILFAYLLIFHYKEEDLKF
ncbi:MAG: signal peptidase II [Hespellia sp.]|nr:signal peptidase II [Hespellia sp.]